MNEPKTGFKRYNAKPILESSSVSSGTRSIWPLTRAAVDEEHLENSPRGSRKRRDCCFLKRVQRPVKACRRFLKKSVSPHRLLFPSLSALSAEALTRHLDLCSTKDATCKRQLIGISKERCEFECQGCGQGAIGLSVLKT